MASKYPTPKRFIPTNPKKYIGDVNNCIYRSSWELKFFKWCDESPSIVKYNSEETVIPYVCPTDNNVHRYFVDFLIQVKTANGSLKTYLIEIKPDAQTRAPVAGKKSKKTYLTEVLTWVKNDAKWKAAREYSKKLGIEFLILTEHDLKV